jgi:hypothetical protein
MSDGGATRESSPSFASSSKPPRVTLRGPRSSAVGLLAALLAALFVGSLGLAGDARAEPSLSPSAEVGGASRMRAALQTSLAELAAPDRNMRRAAARSVETMGATATAAMTDELARLREHPADVVPVLALTHVPPEGVSGDGGDRLDAVLDLLPERAGPAYVPTAATLCLIRALAHIGTPDAVAGFALVALDAQGAFRPDVTRHLTELGEGAIAGLVLAGHARGAATQKWATSALEALGKRTPGDAVQTKSKEVLANVLLAYGRVEDRDALGVVLSFVNADRRIVRDAARESIAEYADLAVPKLRESYGLLTGEAPPLDWPTAWLRQKLFEVMDRIRLEDVDARVHEGLAAMNEGRLAEAVADFDDVLARQPDWDRKAEMVPAYVFYAQSVATTARSAARSNFEKALRLDPSGPRHAQIASALAVLEGRDLKDRGVQDEGPFRRALQLDPGNADAQAEIAQIEDARIAREQRWRGRLIEASGALALLCALILFAGPRRRARRSA